MFYYSQHGDTDDEACLRDEEEGSIIKSLISQLRYVRVYSCNVLCAVKAGDAAARTGIFERSPMTAHSISCSTSNGG